MARRLIPRSSLRKRVLLAALVLGLHVLLVDQLAKEIAGWSHSAEMPPRLQVVYVREMALAKPPKIAPVLVAATPEAKTASRRPHLPQPQSESESGTVAPVVEAAASGVVPELAASAPPSPPVDTPTESPPVVAAAQSAPPMPDVVAAESGDDAVPFVWPGSTRLSYVLTGSYRGEVHGSAQVEWINAAPRYQVNLDVTVGLPFAPLFSRQMRSDGELSSSGLRPQHYQQKSKMAFRDQWRVGLRIAGEGVVADDGRRLFIPPAAPAAPNESTYRSTLQDSASQFVQLTYLFTTQPQLLRPGTRIEFPLLLPAGVRNWAYEVVRLETVYTQFGPVDAFLLQPPSGLVLATNQLLAQAWFAPELGYLPIRIRIQQDAEVFLDLVVKSRPELAAP